MLKIKKMQPLLESTEKVLKALKGEELSPKAKQAVARLEKQHKEFRPFCFEAHMITLEKKKRGK
jgi:hypothetical protein